MNLLELDPSPTFLLKNVGFDFGLIKKPAIIIFRAQERDLAKGYLRLG